MYFQITEYSPDCCISFQASSAWSYDLVSFFGLPHCIGSILIQRRQIEFLLQE